MPLPIISVAQMREWERATWATGQTEESVIARVGERLASRALQMTCAGDLILILAGKGNNGEDARATLQHLRERDVQLIHVNHPAHSLAEVRAALARRPRLILDGLFGIGLNRQLDASWCELITSVNDAQRDVLAIDVPSGLDADSGRVLPVAVRACLTLTVGAPKRGFFVAGAADYVGQLEVADDVGFVPCPLESELQWATAGDFADFPPRRAAGGHKGTFGHAALVAGSLGFHGASVLAARGAQRALPGLVSLCTQREIYDAVAAQLQAVMVHLWREGMDWSKFTAVLFGPGLAAPDLPASVLRTMQRLWNEHGHPVIVDASSLEWLPASQESHRGVRVITPHPGEAARLLSCNIADVQADRPQALRALSKRYGGCWVVLKGQHTLVGRSEGDLFVNSSGNSGLAQGGTGDLLAGYLTGWLAQPALQGHPMKAIQYAVWEHGRAAERLTRLRQNWIVEELAVELGRYDCRNSSSSANT